MMLKITRAERQDRIEELRLEGWLAGHTLDRLPDTHRTIPLLRDIEDLGTEETAALLGISPNAVKIRLHGARQALRALLEREGVGSETSRPARAARAAPGVSRPAPSR